MENGRKTPLTLDDCVQHADRLIIILLRVVIVEWTSIYIRFRYYYIREWSMTDSKNALANVFEPTAQKSINIRLCKPMVHISVPRNQRELPQCLAASFFGIIFLRNNII